MRMKTTIKKLSHRRGELFEKTGERCKLEDRRVPAETSVECLGQRGGGAKRSSNHRRATHGFEKKKKVSFEVSFVSRRVHSKRILPIESRGLLIPQDRQKETKSIRARRQSTGGVRTTAGARSRILRENSLSRTLWLYGLNRCRVTARNVHAP